MVLNRTVTVTDEMGKIWKEVANFKVMCQISLKELRVMFDEVI